MILAGATESQLVDSRRRAACDRWQGPSALCARVHKASGYPVGVHRERV